MTSLADYNNNPGNLKPPGGKVDFYKGQIGVDDNGFAVFKNKDFGRKALVQDLEAKIKRGVNTPEKFIDIYSPAGPENYDEEGRDNYKLYIAQQLGLSGTGKSFSKEHIEKLADAVTAFEGGTWMDKGGKEEPAEAPQAAQAPAAEPAGGDEGERLEPTRRQEIPGVSEADKEALRVIGGVGGASATATLEAGKKIVPLIPNLVRTMTGQALDPARPAPRLALQNWLNTMLQSQGKNVNLPLSKLEELVGNEIRTMSELGEAYKKIQPTPSERVPKTTSIDPRTGQPKQIFKTIPGQPGIDLSPYEVKPTGPLRQMAGRELQTGAELVKSALPSLGRVAVGGLGGLNAAVTGYDAYEMAEKLKKMNDPSWVDYARLASKSLATAGGGLSMIPSGVTQAVGLGLQAPEAIWSGADWFNKARREATKESTYRALTNVDPMGFPLGGP